MSSISHTHTTAPIPDACPAWCALPSDHDLTDPTAVDRLDGSIYRTHESPVLMFAGGCRLDLVQLAALDGQSDQSDCWSSDPAGLRLGGVDPDQPLSAIEARQLAAVLLGAAELLDAAAESAS